MAQYNYGTAWVELNDLAAECDNCPYMNTDEEVEILKSEGAEALVDHLLLYLLAGVDYDPEIKEILLEYIAVQFPDVGDGDCGVRGGEEGSLELRQKAACESVAAGVANLIMTLPEFAIQR